MRAVLDHIVLNVRNLDEVLEFYTKTLGLVPERLDLYREGEVPFPSVRINEQVIIDLLPEPLWGSGETVDTTGAGNLDHFCLALEKDQWQAVIERLAAAGIAIDSGPMTLYGARGNGQAVYVCDPAGNRLELRYYEL